MSLYVIGDIQGCYDAFMQLLKKIKFQEQQDKLIFCGDLVNRGGQSLQVLRWIYSHQQNCQVVLGNHDLSLLAQYYVPKLRKKNNREFKSIFKAHDCKQLMQWLRQQKLMIYKKKYNSVVVHAGIHPQWSLKQAIKQAKKVEKKLKEKPLELFKKMYGVKPNHWSKSLRGMNRIRFAINSFTRMRFMYKNGGMNFKAKGEIKTFPKLIPWFKYKNRKKIKPIIIYGHWSALGLHLEKNTLCLDTGKVWGGRLTAYKLSKGGTIKTLKSKKIIQV